MLGVDTERHGDLDALVKLGKGPALDQKNTLIEKVVPVLYCLARGDVLLSVPRHCQAPSSKPSILIPIDLAVPAMIFTAASTS